MEVVVVAVVPACPLGLFAVVDHMDFVAVVVPVQHSRDCCDFDCWAESGSIVRVVGIDLVIVVAAALEQLGRDWTVLHWQSHRLLVQPLVYSLAGR